MTWNGTVQAWKIDGNLDNSWYCEILSDNLLGTEEYYHMDRRFFVFQQDNDPKHRSRPACDWFTNNNVTVMDWLPQLPDMNPMSTFDMFKETTSDTRRTS